MSGQVVNRSLKIWSALDCGLNPNEFAGTQCHSHNNSVSTFPYHIRRSQIETYQDHVLTLVYQNMDKWIHMKNQFYYKILALSFLSKLEALHSPKIQRMKFAKSRILLLLPSPHSPSRFLLSYCIVKIGNILILKWSQPHSPSNIPSTSWRRIALLRTIHLSHYCRSHRELRHKIHASGIHYFRYDTPTYRNSSSSDYTITSLIGRTFRFPDSTTDVFEFTQAVHTKPNSMHTPSMMLYAQKGKPFEVEVIIGCVCMHHQHSPVYFLYNVKDIE